MTRKSRYGLLLCLILILCVFFPGCSSQNTTIKTTPVPTTPAAKYTAGDIVAMTASSQSEAQLIVSYDASKDQVRARAGREDLRWNLGLPERNESVTDLPC